MTIESHDLLIDGNHYSYISERTLLDYATEHGWDIPTLCHFKGVSDNAHCMVCAVWDDTLGRFVASCEQWVERGHVYETQGQRVREFRREALSLMLYRHDFRCGTCSAKGKCRFFDLVREYQAKKVKNAMTFPEKVIAKHVIYDAGKCILCHRCIGVSQGCLTMHHRAEQTTVSPAPGSWDDIPPDVAHDIYEVCPTGALVSYEPIEAMKGTGIS
ncbi:MAG: 2Fe-2S iron-sulfur cluster-binding protein [Planctomycetaceae bacterium]|nr:2Fe-2S iron-sulfur cluster-binding protein [Planctomycetaceae bacterium]